MTEYAIDDERRALIAVWPGASGQRASAVAELPAGVDLEEIRHLASSLTGLSHLAWREYAYSHVKRGDGGTGPETVETESSGAESGPRPEATVAEGRPAEVMGRESTPTGGSWSAVLDAIRNPGRPYFRGPLALAIAQCPVEDEAHWLGWVLRAADDPDFTEKVVSEVQLELEAVEQARKGDFTSRAEQAGHIDRLCVDPAQVAKADQLLSEDPLGSFDRFDSIDPASAAVAAAHWLHNGAEVVCDDCDVAIVEVPQEADSFTPLPQAIAGIVLTRLEDGRRPRDVVLELIRHAVAVREGRLPSLAAVQCEVAHRLTMLEQQAVVRPASLDVTDILLTPLDPARPARSLLYGLLSGLHGCAALYAHHLAEGCEGDCDEDTDVHGLACESGQAEKETLLRSWIRSTSHGVRLSRYLLY